MSTTGDRIAAKRLSEPIWRLMASSVKGFRKLLWLRFQAKICCYGRFNQRLLRALVTVTENALMRT